MLNRFKYGKARKRTPETVEPIVTTNVVNWTVLIAVLGGLILLVPTVGFTLRLLEVLTEVHLLVGAAIVGTILLVVVVTACWTRVVMSYSELRSREDREEELSELRLLRALQQGVTPNVSPTYQMLPGGMDQEALTQLLQQRQQIAPPTVIDFEQPVEYN